MIVLCVLYVLVPVVLVGAGFLALLAPDMVDRF